jgi:Zn-dependent protease with chaperone function
MITIEGMLCDGNTSRQKAVVLRVYDNGAIRIQQADTDETIYRHPTFNAQVSDRLADTPRFLTFPDGSILETDDNRAVDQLLKKTGKRHWSVFVHVLESRLRYVLIAFLIVLLMGTGWVKYGIPAAAKVIATHLPQALFSSADNQTLKVLDKAFFKPSALASDTESRVRTHLQRVLDNHPSYDLKLRFRKGGKLGPNAFALPGGTIIFTDELVETAKQDDELTAILAHEIGHIVHQHGMRRVVQDSMLSFAILAITGDATGVSELFLGLPAIMTELAYSREFEREADQYALKYLRSREIAPSHFADILLRIDSHQEESSEAQGEQEDHRKIRNYLSTHPPTIERIKAFR